MFKEGIEVKMKIILRAYDHRVLDQSAKRIVEIVHNLNKDGKANQKLKGPVPLPTKISRWTVLRSPHVNKDSREQFEIREHRRLIYILEPTKDFIEEIKKLRLPAGVAIEIKMA